MDPTNQNPLQQSANLPVDPTNNPQQTAPVGASPFPAQPIVPSNPPVPGGTAPVPTPQKTNGLAIVGLVLAFLVPLIGLIVSLVALSQIKKRQEGGHGVAVAGVFVSVVFMVVSTLILIALVISTFGGIQHKARDNKRETDIKAIHGQVEAYYAAKGVYPTLDNMNDPTWRAANMQGFDSEALRDPQGTTTGVVAEPQKNAYSYKVTPTNCNNTTVFCSGYTLTAMLEDSSQSTFTERSLN